ncbi:glycosyltransferase family 2 protein [Inquilinus sp. KBS0705]|nr:glycosyltransferase family 2 protein [Inquilinus sp. KBS0705]
MPMKLSVIVVNNNMSVLLRQSLNSLINACKDIDYELLVVDDASTDNSVTMLQREFPETKLILNKETLGMAKSRNLALEQAKGQYVLLVNADTISGKKTIQHVVDFMDSHHGAGGVGVRMLTPRGNYLTESRIGFSNAWASLLRLTGLARFFPKSRLYKNMDESRVEEDEFATTEVDVINGAFMLLRSSVLNHVGMFDERFMTFGADIDLSFRMRIAGYKNYYFPRTYILNFCKQLKPQFTWHYIKDFYGAMIIFAAKYLFRMPEIKIPAMQQMFAPKYEVER